MWQDSDATQSTYLLAQWRWSARDGSTEGGRMSITRAVGRLAPARPISPASRLLNWASSSPTSPSWSRTSSASCWIG